MLAFVLIQYEYRSRESVDGGRLQLAEALLEGGTAAALAFANRSNTRRRPSANVLSWKAARSVSPGGTLHVMLARAPRNSDRSVGPCTARKSRKICICSDSSWSKYGVLGRGCPGNRISNTVNHCSSSDMLDDTLWVSSFCCFSETPSN